MNHPGPLHSHQSTDIVAGPRPSIQPLPRALLSPLLYFGAFILLGANSFLADNLGLLAVLAVAVLLSALLITSGLQRARRRAAARRLAAPYAQSLDLASRCWLSGMAAGRAGQVFDARPWLQAHPLPTSPRTIVLTADLPKPITPDDLAEEVDIGFGSASSTTEKVVFAGLAGWVALASLTNWSDLLARHPLLLLLYVPVIAGFAYAFGFRPVQLGGVIAGPGLVRAARWGRHLEFHRDSSVLVLWGDDIRNTMACLVDAQGRALRLHFAEAYENPRLQQLLARWTAYPADSTPPIPLPTAPESPPTP